MFVKTLVKRAAKEIIQKEKIIAIENDWPLDFCAESIYQYENIILQVKEAKNYLKVFQIDLDEYKKQYRGEDSQYYDLWAISNWILEELENMGYKVV